MPRVICHNYSQFHDKETNAQFSPVLDRQSGLYIGVAEVSDEAAAILTARSGGVFQVIDDQDFLTLNTPKAAPAPDKPKSGDPITDNAVAAREPQTRETLAKMSFKDLKRVAAERGIDKVRPGTSAEQLIDQIIAADAQRASAQEKAAPESPAAAGAAPPPPPPPPPSSDN